MTLAPGHYAPRRPGHRPEHLAPKDATPGFTWTVPGGLHIRVSWADALRDRAQGVHLTHETLRRFEAEWRRVLRAAELGEDRRLPDLPPCMVVIKNEDRRDRDGENETRRHERDATSETRRRDENETARRERDGETRRHERDENETARTRRRERDSETRTRQRDENETARRERDGETAENETGPRRDGHGSETARRERDGETRQRDTAGRGAVNADRDSETARPGGFSSGRDETDWSR